MHPTDILDLAYYLILAAIVVLIIMNAKNFAVAVSGIAGGTNQILGTISGSGYKLAG